jgi:probable phosphoglycerate mutase
MDSSSPIARILLVRHGQSVANAGGATSIDSTNSLTELGKEQALDFAMNFSHVPQRFILSPFLRARQTAEPILQRFPHVRVEEWQIQEFTYLNSEQIPMTDEQRWPGAIAYWERCDPVFAGSPRTESFSSFLARIRDTIQRLTQVPGGCHILFTHGFWMQAFRLLVLFPQATDLALMSNFRRFHSVNFIRNLESLDFEVADGRIRPLNQEHLSIFTLEGAASNE